MPYFVIHALDAPGMTEVRLTNRPAHRARLRQHDHPVRVRIGGPLLDNEGQMCGTMLVIEATDRAEVEDYLAKDPYMLAGVYQNVSLRAFNWGLGQPEEQIG